LHAVAHADQALRAAAHAAGVEALAVVAHGGDDLIAFTHHAHVDLVGVGVLGDVGQRLLDHAVERDLRGFVELERLDLGVDLQIGALPEFGGQDLDRRLQAEVRQRRRPQVFDDAALQADAVVERGREMQQALVDLGAVHLRQAALQARRVELGCRQQRAELVVQLAGDASALVFARRLQVFGQPRQLFRALRHLGFEMVALGFEFAGMAALRGVEHGALAQEHR
jgi:hypothetical protein